MLNDWNGEIMNPTESAGFLLRRRGSHINGLKSVRGERARACDITKQLGLATQANGLLMLGLKNKWCSMWPVSDAFVSASICSSQRGMPQ
jgi:hypothetical protein